MRFSGCRRRAGGGVAHLRVRGRIPLGGGRDVLGVTRGPGEERAIRVLLRLTRDLRSAAELGDWDVVGTIKTDNPLTTDDREMLKKLAMSLDERASRGRPVDGGDPAEVEKTVAAYMMALRDHDVDRAHGMWAVEGKLDAARKEQMLRDAKEILEAYQEDLSHLGRILEQYDEGHYAVVRLAPPVGGDQSRSLFLILVAKAEGWKVVDMKDIRAEEALVNKLDRLLGRN